MDQKRAIQIRMAASAGSICDYAKELRASCGPLFDGDETQIKKLDTKVINGLVEHIQWLCAKVSDENQKLEKLTEV
ncbi:MAG: hypothetical protein ACM3YE_07160 [Bacteroidota bacterium]